MVGKICEKNGIDILITDQLIATHPYRQMHLLQHHLLIFSLARPPQLHRTVQNCLLCYRISWQMLQYIPSTFFLPSVYLIRVIRPVAKWMLSIWVYSFWLFERAKNVEDGWRGEGARKAFGISALFWSGPGAPPSATSLSPNSLLKMPFRAFPRIRNWHFVHFGCCPTGGISVARTVKIVCKLVQFNQLYPNVWVDSDHCQPSPPHWNLLELAWPVSVPHC